MRWIYPAVLVAWMGIAGCGKPGIPEAAPPASSASATTSSEHAMGADEIREIVKQLGPLQAPLRKPRANDWLAKYHEPGQTFEAFLAYRPNVQAKEYNTLYVQPLGAFSATQKKLVDETASFLGVFYGVRVKTLETLGLSVIPPAARRVHPTWGDRQIKTGYVEGLLREKRPRDAIALIALTTSDLYPDDNWNFVFGEADLQQRVGVWSLYRYGDPEKEHLAVLRRTLKVATHETGHMLGIYHCTAHTCGMNGSNHLEETDASPLWFCAECDAKVIYACGADAAGRYASLAAWARERKMAEEEAYWDKALQAVR